MIPLGILSKVLKQLGPEVATTVTFRSVIGAPTSVVGTLHTYDAVNIGPTAAPRYIIVGLGWRDPNNVAGDPVMTLEGRRFRLLSATSKAGAADVRSYLYILRDDTITTGDLVLETSAPTGLPLASVLGLWTATGTLAPLPKLVAHDGNSAFTFSPPSNGFVIGQAFSALPGTPNTWVGAEKDYDILTANNFRASAASINTESSAERTISVNLGNYGTAVVTQFAPWGGYENVPDIAAWYDASDLSTIHSFDGLVTQWDDKSGNGFHMTSSGSPPTTGIEIVNGLNALGMTNAFLRNFDFGAPQPLTTFWVARLDSSLVSVSPLHLGNTKFYMGRRDTTARWNCWLTSSSEVSLSESITPGVEINTVRTDGATLTYRVGGGRRVGLDTTINGAITPDGIATGTPNMGNTGTFSGAVCELLVFSRALTDDEISRIENDLMLKWGAR